MQDFKRRLFVRPGDVAVDLRRQFLRTAWVRHERDGGACFSPLRERVEQWGTRLCADAVIQRMLWVGTVGANWHLRSLYNWM